MKPKDKDRLFKGLADYGYPLLKPAGREVPEQVLNELLKQDDARLLEGFPVVFCRMLQERRGRLAWESARWEAERELSQKSRERLAVLLALTCHLFQLYGMEKKLKARTQKLLLKLKKGKESLGRLERPFMKSESVDVVGASVSVERMKKHFRDGALYPPETETSQRKQEALEFELLLSKLFTLRQKELLRKRLGGKPMTKTEREYYSRVVKKRLKALANEELHRWARRLVS